MSWREVGGLMAIISVLSAGFIAVDARMDEFRYNVLSTILDMTGRLKRVECATVEDCEPKPDQ